MPLDTPYPLTKPLNFGILSRYLFLTYMSTKLVGGLVGGLFLALGFLLPVSTEAASGTNYVNVVACEQVGADVKLTNFNKTYILTSSCRNAGHGLRQYKLTCVDKNNQPAAVSTRYKVEWADVNSCAAPKDTVAPVITLNGAKVVFSVTDYPTEADLGATAVDNKDGNITSKIKVTNTVDYAKDGIYTITYQVTDVAGNSASETRTVLVGTDGLQPDLRVTDSGDTNFGQGNQYRTCNGDFARQGKPVTPGNVTMALHTENGVTPLNVQSFYQNADTSKVGNQFYLYDVAFVANNQYLTSNTSFYTVVDQYKPLVQLNGGCITIVKPGEMFVDPGITVDTLDPNYTVATKYEQESSSVIGHYTYTVTTQYGTVSTTRQVWYE